MAGILLVSLLSVSFEAVARPAQHTSSYADWVASLLREPGNEIVQQALVVASASRASSLEAFLVAFVEAYETQQPEQSLAHVFAGRSLSNEALIAHLQSRFNGLQSDALLPRTGLLTLQVLSKQAQQQESSGSAMLAATLSAQHGQHATLQHAAAPIVVLSLRCLSAAQPLGP